MLAAGKPILKKLLRPGILVPTLLGSCLLGVAAAYAILVNPASIFVHWAQAAAPTNITMITFGPYPEEEDFERLEKAGVKYMVSLLDPRLPYENTLVERERVRAKKHHMTLEVFPMASIMDHRIFSDYPDELNRAVDFLVNLDAPAYLHCYLGRNRTVHVRDALLKAKLPKRYWTPVAATEDYWALTSRIVNAQAEFRHGNYARTLEILAPVTARDCDVALLRGWSFYRLGMISEATENFRQGLGVDPADTRNLVGLGYCYLRSGQPALAQQQFNAVLEQVSNEPDALAGLGLSHLRLGSKAAAAVAFRKALEEDPRNQEVKAYLQQAEAP